MVATEGLREMEGSALRRLVGRDEAGAGGAARCLVLDCRPFLAHSAGHIRGALNVRCNTIVRRRAKGAVSLEQILPAEGEVRARLRAGLYAAVVVYDERSPRAEALREDSTVALVVRALRRDTARADIRLLAGTGGGDTGAGGGRREPRKAAPAREWGSGLAAPRAARCLLPPPAVLPKLGAGGSAGGRAQRGAPPGAGARDGGSAAISPERGCPGGLSRLRGIERAPWPCPGPEEVSVWGGIPPRFVRVRPQPHGGAEEVFV